MRWHMPTPCGSPCGERPAMRQAKTQTRRTWSADRAAASEARRSAFELCQHGRLVEAVDPPAPRARRVHPAGHSKAGSLCRLPGKLWHTADIAAFETSHPEVTDADAKWRKIRKDGRRALYARRMKGETPPPNV